MTLLILLSMYGLAFILSQSEILDRPRRWLMLRSEFITRLLLCWFCVGFWSGIIIYALYNPLRYWAVGECIVWGCAGSAVSGLLNAVFDRLNWTITGDK